MWRAMVFLYVVVLVLAGCSDDPVQVDEAAVRSGPTPIGGMDAEWTNWLADESWMGDTRDLQIRTLGGEPSDPTSRLALVLGGVADEPGEIGIEDIACLTWGSDTVGVSIVADQFDLGPDGVQAFGLDLIFPRTVECQLDAGGMSADLLGRGWYWGGHNVRVIDGVQYVRLGAFAGSGVGIQPGEKANLYDLVFDGISAGDGQVVVWTAWDHIGWYVSDCPMPRRATTAHVMGCWRYDGSTVGMGHPIHYGRVGDRHVAHVYAPVAPGFGDFMLDVRYPIWCDWVYAEAGLTTETFESVAVTQVEAGLLRIVGTIGTGHLNPNDYGWGQIVRLDFVPRQAGVQGWWNLDNFGGSLAGMETACTR